MKRFALMLLLAAMLGAAAASAAEKPAPLLPDVFAGWQKSAAQRTTDPAAADPVYANLLKEFGFTDLEKATYTKPDRQMTLKAARFNDASGAYGAFTFYKTPEMQTEKIGDQAASNNQRVLFYRGNVLVDVVLDRVTPMSAGELRELAEAIPLPPGSARNLPTLPTFLPRPGYVRNSAKYVMGPVGLASIDAPVPAALIDFEYGAELALGKYNTGAGLATLTLISYPTPAIAGARLRAIEAAHPPGSGDASPPFMAKRSGPLVAVVTGQISPREAKSLLASVNYDADVTWNQNTFLSGRDNVGTLLVGIIVLTGIILGLALVAGIAFGGVRILLKRMFPDRVFDRSEDVGIIQLNLRG